MFGFVVMNAQTVVKEDKALVKTIDTMLISGESVNVDFYGKDFFEYTRVWVQADTASGTGTGDVVLTVITKGSTNYADWNDLDTVSISATDDNVAVSPKVTVFYPYVRFTTAVAGTGDSVDVAFNYLFDVNQ